MGTCALDAALGTRSPTQRLPIKAFRGGRSNRCIMTVHRQRRNAPAICGPLRRYGPQRHFRVRHRERFPPPPPRARLATALAPTTLWGLPGAGVGGAPARSLAQPRGLGGNRRRARGDRGKHEEGHFLRAETGVDDVGEGGCGRRRACGWAAGRRGVGPGPSGSPAVGLPAAPGSRSSLSSSWTPASRSLPSSLGSPQPPGPPGGTRPTRLLVAGVEDDRVATALQPVAAS